MSDMINRQAAIDAIMAEPSETRYPAYYAEKLRQLPAEDCRPEFEDFILFLQTVHQREIRIRAIEDSKFPDPQHHKDDVRNYQTGWNEAIDYVINGEIK